MRDESIGLIKEYKTPHFRIVVDAIPDDDLDLSGDETGEVAARLNSGECIAFCARARAYVDGEQIASDYLGGCIYESLEAFREPRGYFADMVRNVVAEARKRLLAMQAVHVRKAA